MYSLDLPEFSIILEIRTENGPRFLMEGENLSIETLLILLYRKDSIEYMYIATFTSGLQSSLKFGTQSRFLMPATSKKVNHSILILPGYKFPSILILLLSIEVSLFITATCSSITPWITTLQVHPLSPYKLTYLSDNQLICLNSTCIFLLAFTICELLYLPEF